MKLNFLEKILLYKKQEIDSHRRILQEDDLQHMIQGAAAPRSLAEAIRKARGLAIIAEMKKGSPAEGIIRENYQPEQIAKSYVQAGADAISVLTDEKFFSGKLSHMNKIRPQVDVPILRKDFIISCYQLLEARAFGADAVLLIATILELEMLQALLEMSRELGLEALVEVHTEEDVERAREAGASIFGINHRNLETFEIDLETTARLAPRIKQKSGTDAPGPLIVAESGIHTQADLQRVAQAGADAVLVGTHFMRSEDPGQALRNFKEAIRNGAGEDLRHQAA